MKAKAAITHLQGRNEGDLTQNKTSSHKKPAGQISSSAVWENWALSMVNIPVEPLQSGAGTTSSRSSPGLVFPCLAQLLFRSLCLLWA